MNIVKKQKDMKTHQQHFPEGTWFAVPLRDGGFCRGLMARTDGKGRAFGYFFGPKASSADELPNVSGLRPTDAILVGRFGDLGLISGKWKVIGKAAPWDRAAWPMLPFIRVDEKADTAMMTTLNDEFEIISDEPCDPSLAKAFPKDSMMGYGFVEIRLTRLLNPEV
jgi:hypothetical protein